MELDNGRRQIDRKEGERLVLRAEDYSNALQQSGVHGAEALAELLPRFTGVHISRSAIAAPSADALQAAGWLGPARQAAHAAGPDEAPGIDAAAEANDLLLALPGAGRLLVRLTECRRAVLAILLLVDDILCLPLAILLVRTIKLTQSRWAKHKERR